MFNFDYNSGKIFGINGNYSNYSVNQFAGTLPLNDTIKLYQSNRNFSLMPRLTFVGDNLVQLVQFNVSYMDLLDHNTHTAENNKVNSTILLLSYIQTYKSLGTSFSLTLNHTTMATVVENRKMTGVSLGATKSFFENKLSTSITASASTTNIDNFSENFKGHISTLMLNAYYRPFKQHSIRASVYVNKINYPNGSSYKSYTESKIIFGYVYTF
jgi:hypothetical protein